MSDQLVHSFDSPSDFLSYLQNELASSFLSGSFDPEFASETQKQLANAGFDPAEFASPNHGLNLAINALTDEIMSGVDERTRVPIARSVALGVLTAGTINARILRSPDRKYAIVVHSGLMLLLNKYIKHVIGMGSPRQVVYCNRKNAADLTANDIREYMFELVANCSRFGAPYGAMLRLDDAGQIVCSGFLHLAEMFVVCHELGHFLNGDLDDSSVFVSFNNHQWVQEYVENIDHAREYAADAAGFRLMQTILGNNPSSYKVEVLSPIVILFNLLFLLGARESSTHPHPLDRSLNLVEQFYGPERARAFKESYNDPTNLVSLFRDV